MQKHVRWKQIKGTEEEASITETGFRITVRRKESTATDKKKIKTRES